MGAYKQNVPLRRASAIFRLNDGTMCRMPSPLPGPLREVFVFEPAGLSGNLAEGLLLLRNSEAMSCDQIAALAMGKAT